MPRFIDFQTNFSTGELDPLLRSRIDIPQYANALSKATNVVLQPQGGMRRRAGSRHILELPNSSTPSAANGVRLVSFEFSVDDSYMLCFVAGRMYVIKSGTTIANINGSGNNFLAVASVTGAMLSSMCWTQSADTLILVHPDLPPIKIVRGANDASWTASTITFDSIPKYAFTLTVTNPAGTITPDRVSGNVRITASSSVFTAASVGQYINASPQGRAKIVAYISGTVVDVITEYPFFNTNAIATSSWEYEAGYEDVWSSGRGWPRTVTFHEGRLYFGGSKSRPSTVWGSKVGLFFDFQASESLDDDAIDATLDTNQLNTIVDMTSSRDLQVFTTGGEFFVPQTGTDPVTPATLVFKAVSRNGMKPGTRVQSLETGTLFVQRQGKALNEFLFSDTQLTYVTQRISLLSGHLLKTPTRISLRRATSTDEGDLLYIVNGADGSMAVYSILRSQQIVAPSEFTTDGEYMDVNIDVTQTYVVVKRTFNSVVRYFVERFDDTLFTDCAFIGAAASGATSLPHIGKAINVITDGVPQSNETVSGGGAVTFDRPSTTKFEVGLPYTVYAKTMPVDVKLQSGTRIGFKKRIVQVNVIVDDTQHLNVNNQALPFRNFDNPLLDLPIQEFTGIKRIDGIRGYTTDATIEITQTLPLKMTLLGLEFKVAVNQGT
jgi:hypothetical protein